MKGGATVLLLFPAEGVSGAYGQIRSQKGGDSDVKVSGDACGLLGASIRVCSPGSPARFPMDDVSASRTEDLRSS